MKIAPKKATKTLLLTSSFSPKNYPSSGAEFAMDANMCGFDLFYIFLTHREDHVVLLKGFQCVISRSQSLKVAPWWNKATLYRLSLGLSTIIFEYLGKSSKNEGYSKRSKGSHQEVNPGVYPQSAPKLNEHCFQNRLRRDVNRFLGIERFDYEEAIRCAYAPELPNGKWVDMTSGVKLFNIHW